MSKVLETLRQSGHGMPALEVVPPLPDGGAEEETPFIEVGPKQSFEASASVLASIPAVRSPVQPSASRTANPPASAPASLPKPHNVLFRALTPTSRFAPELVAFHAPAHPDSLRYADLLQAVMGAVAGKTGKKLPALLFLGVNAEVGATTVLLNLAVTAARQGCRVVVLDANLRRPAVAERLGLSPAPGLTDLLCGDCTLGEALRGTEQPHLSVVTAGSPAPTLASFEALQGVLQDLHAQSDLVLVDGPRWDGRTGTRALAAGCDAVFLVVRRPEADTPPASDLIRTLPEQGVALAGCVLTGE